MNDKLRVGMVGGGNESFMGAVHRAAIEESGCAELVCGAFGSTRHSSYDAGKTLGLSTKRTYGTYRDMFRREAALPKNERMDFVAILAPNAMHYPVAMSATDAGFSIFSEKPFTCNLDEAVNLTRKQRSSGLAYGVAMAYPGYPMLRKMREMITEDKSIGTLRKVVSSFLLGWMAPRLETAGNRQAGWRTDPRRSGPAGCLADLCGHCQYVTEWVTGLRIAQVCADTRPTVPGRILDDDCTVMVRFEDEVRGVFLASQIATGRQQGLCIEVFGDKGSIAWVQGEPERLLLRGVDGTEKSISGGQPADNPPPGPNPFGGDAAYISALAASYRSFAEHLRRTLARKSGSSALPGFMTMDEGLRAVTFVDAVLQNTAVPEEDEPLPDKWMPFVVPPVLDL